MNAPLTTVLRSVRHWALILLCLPVGQPALGQSADTALLPVKTLRIAIHVFQDNDGNGNFSGEVPEEVRFLHDLVGFVNHRYSHLDTLRPAMPSPYIQDCRVRFRVDTVYYHRDTHAWDCSSEIDAFYMRDWYVDYDTTMDYRQKYQTLPIFIGGNNAIVGGHSRGIGDRGYIAVRGYFNSYQANDLSFALDECGRNLVHELAHCMGLIHNFQGGTGGNQCDNCDDDGCPVQGTSNNIMDLWPSYGYALSKCQFDLIRFHLDGGRGNISEVVINDSCYRVPGYLLEVNSGDTLVLADTVYSHGDVRINPGGTLLVRGYLSVPGNSGIRMEPGSKLILEGGTLGNLCGDLWQGVDISGASEDLPASVEVVGHATWENAVRGIYATGRARLLLDHSEFRNCVASIVIEGDPADELQVRNGNFRITTRLNHYEEGITPEYFIRAEGIGRLETDSCRFNNEPGTLIFDANWMGTGILSDAGCLVVDSCIFSNLTNGLVVRNPDPGATLRVSGSVFDNNRYGIKTGHAGWQQVSSCEFTLQRFNSGTTIGICLYRPRQFIVDGNRFGSVYGSGKQVGIMLKNPGTETSPVFDNLFTNLPAAIFLDGIPGVEEELLSWARGELPVDSLRLGPQFRFNRFSTTPLTLVAVADSTQGTAAGTPSDVAGEYVTPASSWDIGSFGWYTDRLKMSAFEAWKPDSKTEFLHGWYWFMNYPGSGGIRSLRGEKNDFGPLAAYLSALDSIERFQANAPQEDVYTALTRTARFPAAARSARMAGYWSRFGAEEEPWLTAALAGIAGVYCHQDSLLIQLGTVLATRNRDDWAATGCYPGGTRIDTAGFGDFARMDFDLPGMELFRFHRPGLFPETTPAFMVYPSPASNYLIVQPMEGYTYRLPWNGRLVSALGRVVGEFTIRSWQEQRIDLSAIPSGAYIVEFFSDNQYLGARKFVKITSR